MGTHSPKGEDPKWKKDFSVFPRKPHNFHSVICIMVCWNPQLEPGRTTIAQHVPWLRQVTSIVSLSELVFPCYSLGRHNSDILNHRHSKFSILWVPNEIVCKWMKQGWIVSADVIQHPRASYGDFLHVYFQCLQVTRYWIVCTVCLEQQLQNRTHVAEYTKYGACIAALSRLSHPTQC